MKIKDSQYLGLRLTKDLQNGIFNAQLKTIKDYTDNPKLEQLYSQQVRNLLSSSDNQNYLMTQTSLTIANKIKINEKKFDGRLFNGLKVGKKITVLINNSLMYRYAILEDCINCLIGRFEHKMENGKLKDFFTYTMFKIDTLNGLLHWNDNPNEDNNPFQNENFLGFIKILVFIEFSELETVYLKPNQKNNKSKKHGKVLNESSQDIIVVDSTWNKIISISGFEVSGHLRMQPCGKGFNSVKLIYIDSYTKGGYTRRAKKQIISE